jgi:hypothetical protein
MADSIAYRLSNWVSHRSHDCQALRVRGPARGLFQSPDRHRWVRAHLRSSTEHRAIQRSLGISYGDLRHRVGEGVLDRRESQQPRFALFAKPTAATAGLTDKFSTVLDAELRSPFHEDGVWLVRPDGYVACAAAAGNEGAIARYFAEHL